MKIVGLTGRTGAGKRTVAGRMYTAHGFEQMGFMEPVWEALQTAGLVRVNDVHAGGYITRPLPGIDKTPTQLAREMRAWGISIAPDFWLRAIQQRVETAQALGVDRIVITDVMDDIEAEWIHTMGGEIWYVSRAPDYGLAGLISTKYINRGIVNDGSLDGLYWRVEQLVDELLHPNGEVVL